MQMPTTIANVRPFSRDYIGETDIEAYNARHKPKDAERLRRVNLAKQRLADKHLNHEDKL